MGRACVDRFCGGNGAAYFREKEKNCIAAQTSRKTSILRLCRGIFVFFRQFCSDARKWMDGVPASSPAEEENAPACVGPGNIGKLFGNGNDTLKII